MTSQQDTQCNECFYEHAPGKCSQQDTELEKILIRYRSTADAAWSEVKDGFYTQEEYEVALRKISDEAIQALTSWKDKEVKLARLKGGHHALADLDKWIELHELDGDQIKDGIVHMMESLKQQVESLQSQGGKNE